MSKLTSVGLGLLGGVVGFFVGGPTGAFVGFGLGLGLGTIIDPTNSDTHSVGEPMQDLEMMTNIEGLPLPDLLGTSKMTGNLLYYGGNKRNEITEEQETGGGGSGGSDGDKEEVVTGYKYYLSWAMGFCMGPVDNLYTVWADDKIVWSGNAPRSEAINGEIVIGLGSGDRGDLPSESHDEYGILQPGYYGEFVGDNAADEGFMGLMYFYFGTDDQTPNDELGDLMLEEGAIESLDYHIPYRRQCYAFLYKNYVGGYNRCPTIKVVVRKAPECSFDT